MWPSSRRAFSPTRRPRGFPVERLQCLGRHHGRSCIRIPPALQGKPGLPHAPAGLQPRGLLSRVSSVWWPSVPGCGGRVGPRVEAGCSEEHTPGAGFKSRPGPHPGGCTQQVQPRLIHGARHLPSEPCPAGRLRGRHSVSREQHGVFGRLSDMADEHGQWSLAAWVASRPCHSVDV